MAGILAAELVGGGNLEHRVPVDRGVVVSGRRGRGRSRGGQIDQSSRRGGHLGAVDEAIAARPHGVVGLRQIGHDEPALVVRDNALDVAHLEVARFRDHPDAGLWTARASDHASDIVVVNGDSRSALLGVGHQEECREEQRQRGGGDGEPAKVDRVHHLCLQPSAGRGSSSKPRIHNHPEAVHLLAGGIPIDPLE